MHSFFMLSTFTCTVSLLLISIEAFDKTFLQLALDITNHSDVILISDSLPGLLLLSLVIVMVPSSWCKLFPMAPLRTSDFRLNFTSNPKVPEKIRRGYQISYVGTEEYIWSNFKAEESMDEPIKIIVSYSTVRDSLNVLRQLGSHPTVKETPTKFWILLYWPHPISDAATLNATLKNEFMNSIDNFTVSHDVYVAFRNSGVNISFHSGRDTRFFKQPLEGFWFYELYTLNGVLIYNQVENLASTIVQCGTCTSQTIRRLDLRGLLLRFEGVLDSEFNDDTLFTEVNGKLEFAESFASRILEIFKTTLNIRVEAFQSDNWGSRLENGSWVGVVKDVYDGKIDVGVTSTVMLPSRASLIAFLPATDQNILTAFFKPPSLNAIRDIFMQPFQKSLWGAVFATWFALASCMILFTMIRKKFGATSATSSDPTLVEPDLSGDSFIWVLATACQQGWDEHPHALSLRTIFISGSFTGVIAYAGYSAAIVSTLSLRIDPIQSPEALLESNLRIGMRAGFINDLLQKSTTQDIVNALYRRLSSKESERLVNVSAGVALIRKSDYAFVCTKEQFYDIVKGSSLNDSDICGITELYVLKQGFKAGMFTGKTFPYREVFRFILIMIRERGILWRIRNDFTYTRRCLEATDNSGRALGANDVFTAFMILSGGYFLSISFLILEKMVCLNPISYIQ